MPHWRMAAVAAGLMAVAVVTGGNGPVTDGTIVLTAHGGSARQDRPKTFVVRAKPVTGLYPGVVKGMTVTLRNPYDFDLRVTSLTGKVTDSSKRSCRPGAKTVFARTYSGKLPLVVPARSTRDVGAVPIAMAPDASEKCRKTTFTVELTGRATKAGR